MNARAYYEKYGIEACDEVCQKAGTKLSYFRQIMIGHRSPSPKLALRLEKASGGEMTKEALLWGADSDA